MNCWWYFLGNLKKIEINIDDIFLNDHLEQCNVIGIACVDVAGMKNDLFDSQHFPDNDETSVHTLSQYWHQYFWCFSVNLCKNQSHSPVWISASSSIVHSKYQRHRVRIHLMKSFHSSSKTIIEKPRMLSLKGSSTKQAQKLVQVDALEIFCNTL